MCWYIKAELSVSKLNSFTMLKVVCLLLAFVSLSIAVAIDPHAQFQSAKTRDLFDTVYPIPQNLEELTANYWLTKGRNHVKQRVQQSQQNLNKAKNVIMFLGDGMSLNTITAARILKGQRAGRNGEEEQLFFEQFPYTGLSKTYCANVQVADSACTATAYLTGVKTNMLTLGVTAAVQVFNCTAGMDPANHVTSIATWAQAAGKSTGFITTTTLTHASPSGSYAHTAFRMWESDTDIINSGEDPTQCMDIATQLITQAPGRNFDVIMGGGMGKFLPNTKQDFHGNMGERSDGRNLLATWQATHSAGVFVGNRDQLLSVNNTKAKSVLGIFASGLMDFHRTADAAKQPTLAEMTEVALNILSQNENGYFIFIEGGLIDYGNHNNQPGISLDETIELEKAIKVAREMTSVDDTLIVLTSDHAHPLTIAGFPGRGSDILKLNEYSEDSRGVKFTTLQYAVGPEQYLDENGNRKDLTGQINSDLFVFPSYVNSEMGSHAGDDVGIFASGPYEHLFSGTVEQNTIPLMMAYAACIGDGPTMCDEDEQ